MACPAKLARRLLLLALALLSMRETAADGRLTDGPLELPGRPPRPQASAAAAAGAAGLQDPDERAGYFVIPSPASNGAERHLFFWFFQARNPTTGAAISNAPIIAWMNGGPGCSSLFGLFFENGPYTINETGLLAANPNAWTAAAHMLYIDQPVGTGLSYSSDSADGSTSELDVAKTLSAFLQALYKDPNYSRYSRSKLILAGESFAGHYLPAAAAWIKATAPSLPLSGVALGNPFVHGPTMYESYPAWALQRGLVPAALAKSAGDAMAQCRLLASVCSVLDSGSCDAASKACEYDVWGALLNGAGSQLGNVNLYNVRGSASCAKPSDCYAQLDARLEAYINANRGKLGVPSSVTYQSCSDPPYWNLWPDMTKSYDDLVAALLDKGVSVMVYNGDDDMLCNSLGNAKWIDALLWSNRTAWASVKPMPWAGGQFRRLGPLSFVRFAKAGHMVPMDQPTLSLQLLQQWLAGGQPVVVRRQVKGRRLQHQVGNGGGGDGLR